MFSLTPTELVELTKSLKPPELIEYWKKVKETIHLFDEIIVKYVIQWSAVLLAMIGASTLVFPDSSLIAGIVALTAILVSIPIAIKCWFYYELLEEALHLAEDIENAIFKNKDLAKKVGLTHRLCKISTKPHLGTTFFGLTIFLPFIFLLVTSSTLTLIYFNVATTPCQVVFSIFVEFAIVISVIFVYARVFGEQT